MYNNVFSHWTIILLEIQEICKNKKLLYLVSSVHKHILFKWIIILKKSKTKYINFTDVRPFPAKLASTDNNYQSPLLAKGLTSVKFMYWILYFFNYNLFIIIINSTALLYSTFFSVIKRTMLKKKLNYKNK